MKTFFNNLKNNLAVLFITACFMTATYAIIQAISLIPTHIIFIIIVSIIIGMYIQRKQSQSK